MPTDADGSQLLDSLSRAARGLVGRRSISDVESTLADIVSAAVETVPGADAGGVTMTENSKITSRNPTAADIHLLDDLQSRLGEGPCITAADQPPDEGFIHARDLASEESRSTWPRFAPQAVDRGFRSLLSTQLSAERGLRAALNLYSRRPDAFDEPARMLAGLFGLQASMLLYGSQHVSHLNLALETRDVIGQAKGILQERFDVAPDQAFQMLVRSSQETNVRLVAVAEWLVENRGRDEQ